MHLLLLSTPYRVTPSVVLLMVFVPLLSRAYRHPSRLLLLHTLTTDHNIIRKRYSLWRLLLDLRLFITIENKKGPWCIHTPSLNLHLSLLPHTSPLCHCPHSSSLCTLSNGFSRFTKTRLRSDWPFLYYSKNTLKAKIASLMLFLSMRINYCSMIITSLNKASSSLSHTFMVWLFSFVPL